MYVPRAVVFVCLISMLLAAGGWASAGPVTSQVAAAVALPDGAAVVLDAVYVESVVDGYAAVRDTWAHSQSLLVSTDAAVQANWTVKVTGQMTTIDGQRVLAADGIQLYANLDGSPAPPMPACILAGMPGIGLVDIPPLPARRGIGVPMNSAESTEVFDGSIASAKRVGGTLALTGKVVTAVFHDVNGLVSSFYIQESGTGGVPGVYGIKVVPAYAVPAEPGNLVDLEDCTVVASDTSTAECHVRAASVKCTGDHVVPKALGLNQRTAASGHFGWQQALYSGTGADLTAGIGIIGTRVRVWGKVSSVSGSSCWIDDGTGLKSAVSGERTGIRVIYESATPPAVNSMVAGATGILGAEMDGSGNAVPVVRVPQEKPATSRIVYVKPSGSDANSGLSWANAVATVAKALEKAVSGDEVWVAAGTYAGSAASVSMKDGVSLYGGFVGTASETTREQRNWSANITVLDGTGTASSVVHATVPVTVPPRIDGFTIRGGYPNYGGYGGGIYCTTAVVICNNIITNNFSTTRGAGIYCTGAGAVIWSNTIQNNTVSPILTPSSTVGGAGIYLVSSSVCIQCNTISGNVAQSTLNKPVSAYGGGIYIDGGNPTVFANTVTGNTVTVTYGGTCGSGIYATGASPVLLNNTISANTGDSGVYLSGGSSTIADNIISSHAYTGITLSGGTPHLVNNAIVSNATGVSFSFTDYSAVITNNIVAFNSSKGISKSGSGNPRIDYNCVYNPNGSNYYGLSASPHDVNASPGLANLAGGDMHLNLDSPCIDAGYNADVQNSWVDIDGDIRIQGTQVDIGVDEIPECAVELISMSPATATLPVSSPLTLTAYVYDRTTHLPLADRRVDFAVTAGSITAVSPDGHLNTPPSPPISGWGTTDSAGNTTVAILTPSVRQTVLVTASTSSCVGPVSTQSVIYPPPYHVGFLYDLARGPEASNVDTYLTHIVNKSTDVIYDRIADITSGIDPSLNVIFVVVPTRDLYTSEINALSTFVQSGREKRVVLIGEWNDGFRVYNARLNPIATAIGMNTQFSTGTTHLYDEFLDLTRLCAVNQSHYLMAGVTKLWDALTDTFVSGWDAYARPLAYIYSDPTLPWILEEDTATAGSRIAIHDASMLESVYDDASDLTPDKNFKFIHNLCTIFPQ